jgi:2'-5' RNA ligase
LFSKMNHDTGATSNMLHQSRETIPSLVHDHPDWHHGRRNYSVWLIELGGMEIAQKVAAAKEHLSPFLIKPYRRQPHITLFVCGFLADAPRYDDDYGAGQFGRHAQLLREAAVKPFTVEIGGLNSFASAPFLEVADPGGGIDRVRTLLSATGKEVGRSSYTPHLTVGLYSRAFPGSLVCERITSFPKDPCKLTVDRITFATYQAQEMAGVLTYKYAVALQTA